MAPVFVFGDRYAQGRDISRPYSTTRRSTFRGGIYAAHRRRRERGRGRERERIPPTRPMCGRDARTTMGIEKEMLWCGRLGCTCSKRFSVAPSGLALFKWPRYLGLTPQANYLSPLRGSGGDKPRPYESEVITYATSISVAALRLGRDISRPYNGRGQPPVGAANLPPCCMGDGGSVCDMAS